MFLPRRPGDEDPPHDPETPPDSTDPAGVCPRCGKASNFVQTGAGNLAFRNDVFAAAGGGEDNRIAVERVSTFECLGCHQGTAVMEVLTVGNKPWRESGGGINRWRGVSWWPAGTGAAVSELVPDRIRNVYQEGLRCLGVSAPRAAAVMFGRTLEAIVRDRGREKAKAALYKSLAAGLNVMADEGKLSADLASWASELRLARNAGGHDELVDDVTPDARSLSKLLDQLLTNLYVVPSRIRRAKELSPPR